MSGKYRAFLSFAGAVVLLAVSLMLLNRFPLSVQHDTARTFTNIEEARTELGLQNVPVPAYFPQSIIWPPAKVLAQGRPSPAVLLEFHRAGSEDIALVIVQSSDDSFARNSSFGPLRATERVPYALKGRDAVLTVGACRHDEPCARLAWTEGASRITVEMKSTPFELIRIAESMVR